MPKKGNHPADLWQMWQLYINPYISPYRGFIFSCHICHSVIFVRRQPDKRRYGLSCSRCPFLYSLGEHPICRWKAAEKCSMEE